MQVSRWKTPYKRQRTRRAVIEATVFAVVLACRGFVAHVHFRFTYFSGPIRRPMHKAQTLSPICKTVSMLQRLPDTGDVATGPFCNGNSAINRGCHRRYLCKKTALERPDGKTSMVDLLQPSPLIRIHLGAAVARLENLNFGTKI